jgi:hypothetical protein
MNSGICTLSIIPLRKEPSHKSELISQLLFGETYAITNQQPNWLFIRCLHDEYEGWIDENQHSPLLGRDFGIIGKTESGIALELVSSAASSVHAIPLVIGSSLPGYDGLNFKIGKEKFIYNGQALQMEGKNAASIERIAMRYLNAPYLWGGRSPFGIDCSGFTQIVYKFTAFKLFRDAYQQAGQGATVNFIEESQPGDLAFFANDEGRIIHTGLVIKDKRIIHASGKVRIDKINHYGIYNNELKKYTHQLKIIKRML